MDRRASFDKEISGLLVRDRRRARRRIAVLVLVLGLVVAGVSTLVPPSGPTVQGVPSTTSPSGVAMPTSDLPGWRHVYSDDFDGTALGAGWGTYEGVPSGDPYSTWSPGHVVIADSLLTLTGYQEKGKWITGGVSNWGQAREYGRWEVRFRADASDEISFHFLLWPQAEQWPPELDFLENFGGDRSSASGFVHWRSTSGAREKKQADLRADFTQWQTVGVEWSPTEVAYTLNGEVWATFTGNSVPHQPMWLGLQAQSGACQRNAEMGFPTCPSAGTPARADIQIDWISIYAPA